MSEPTDAESDRADRSTTSDTTRLDDPGRDPKGLEPAAQPVRRRARPGQRAAPSPGGTPADTGPADEPEEPPTTTLTGSAGQPLRAELAGRDDHGRAGEHRRPVVDPHRQPAAGDVDGDRALGPQPSATSAA